MNRRPSKLKRFIRNNSPLFAVMFFLGFLNILTTNFPWALFPIAAMMIPVFISFTHIFLSDDEPAPAFNRRETQQSGASAEMLKVSSAEVASYLAQARSYKREIDAMANAATEPNKKARLRDLANQVNEWMKSVEAMAKQIDDFKRNKVIQSDLKRVPESVKALTRQLVNEQDPRVKAQLERTLAARSDQLAALEKLQNTMRQAEIQLESTIATLGTIYSQALATQSTNQVADYSHLSAEVDEQAQLLKDQLEALEEVKLDRTASNLSQSDR
jgi:hypothetical protein